MTPKPVKTLVRTSLIRAGARLGPTNMRRLRSAHSYLDLGSWAGSLPPMVDDRTDLFAMARDRVTGNKPLYLEFGVYEGGSIRWWAENLSDPDAQFIGFDSFEGLPEDWNHERGKGAFAVNGAPAIDDERVSFVKGWFDDTLSGFEVPDHNQLVVNIDCDLYSSTVVVLDRLTQYFRPGTLIYFDELNDRDHELRALREHLGRVGGTMAIKPVGAAQGGVNWLFEIR